MMGILEKKIDFMLTIEVRNANPNGDPLNGNMPRDNVDGYGEISDVCIKRKIRNRMQDMGHLIFVQANERIEDEFRSLEKRFKKEFKNSDSDAKIQSTSCEKWLDVRSFGQVMTYLNRAIGIRGPVSITLAKSLSPINAQSMQITRSTNGKEAAVGKDRSPDTMGMKHFVEYGVYLVKGSINVFFSEKTGFTKEDSEVLKEALRTLFVNDSSAARPEGSMQVKEMFWFEHPNKTGLTSSAKIFELLEYEKLDYVSSEGDYDAYNIRLNDEKLNSLKAEGLLVEQLEGL